MTAEKKSTTNMIGADPDASEIPPRTRLDMLTPAELAVWHSVQAVSRCLIEATTLLDRAREKVADYVDGVEPVEDETEHRTSQQIEEDKFRAAMNDPELQRRNFLGLASNAAAQKPSRSSQNIRETALAHACRTYGDSRRPKDVVEAAAKFEAYLRGDALIK